MVDEAEHHPLNAGVADGDERLGDLVRRPDEREAAAARDEALPDRGELGAVGAAVEAEEVHDDVRGLLVGVLQHRVVLGPRLVLGVRAEDGAVRRHVDARPASWASEVMCSTCAVAPSGSMMEQKLMSACRAEKEMPAGEATALITAGERPPRGFGSIDDREVVAGEIERFRLGRQPADDVDPFLPVLIPGVVREGLGAEHRLLVREPAHHQATANRPFDAWSMVVAIFAATTGWMAEA